MDDVIAAERTRTNWAGNVTYRASALARPTSVDELQQLVSSTPRLTALGSRHSFNTIADTDAVQVSLSDLPPVLDIDTSRRVVRVAAGMTHSQVAAGLEARGWALGNLASLPHISTAGAVATGTHGSGVRNPSLAQGGGRPRRRPRLRGARTRRRLVARRAARRPSGGDRRARCRHRGGARDRADVPGRNDGAPRPAVGRRRRAVRPGDVRRVLSVDVHLVRRPRCPAGLGQAPRRRGRTDRRPRGPRSPFGLGSGAPGGERPCRGHRAGRRAGAVVGATAALPVLVHPVDRG
ncbi:FAD-binding protein [Curtobacterium flaccumfaciens pv. flaccumfaciens]